MMGDQAALLDDVVTRRCPDLGRPPALEEMASLPEILRDRLRRAVVDEMCEQDRSDPQADRRALMLEQLLVRLDAA